MICRKVLHFLKDQILNIIDKVHDSNLFAQIYLLVDLDISMGSKGT